MKVVLSDTAIKPTRATEGAAGYDLYAPTGGTLEPGKRVLVSTGVSVQVRPHMKLDVVPRSGLALKHGVTVLNSPGLVDSDYRGELGVILVNLSDQPFTWERGERLAQFTISPVALPELEVVDELDATERGAGGFGSTGR